MSNSLNRSEGAGKLFVLGTTIGNNEDFPARSLALLNSADLLVFEEDQPARRALKAAGVHRQYLKLSEHAEEVTLDAVRDALMARKTVAYMSDQGMPNLADPGRLLLEIAKQCGASVHVVPGPSALSAAVAACPFVTGGFYFFGFLPRSSEQRVAALKSLNSFPDPVIIFDTPYRRQAVLADVAEALGPNRRVFIALDISGPNELYLDMDAAQLKNELSKMDEDLNFVMILQPSLVTDERYPRNPQIIPGPRPHRTRPKKPKHRRNRI
jgi:16S rRNA (cytidine1402-2'-O)-methyltransferase